MATASAKRGYAWMAAISAVVGYVAWSGLRAPSVPVVAAPAAPVEAPKPERKFDDLAATGAVALRSSARDPDSFRLVAVYHRDNGSICYEFRARNGFGGMNLSHAMIDPKGNLRGPGDGGYPSGWNKLCAGIGVNVLSDAEAGLDAAGPPR